LSPVALLIVALVGAVTLLMAAFAALVQTDIKRILAYSTISQIGYMFLALGVGAWSSAIFHLMTHAFFKALLFLAAGAVVYSLHHEHNILRMGGLRRHLPVAFWSFVIGSAALAALPLTAGFYSKDEILAATYLQNPYGAWLLAAGLLGALVTAIYSFRLVFIVFFGEVKTMPSAPAGALMAAPLMVLCVLALGGGWIALPLANVLPANPGSHDEGLLLWMISAVPIIGVLIAALTYLKPVIPRRLFTESRAGGLLVRLWFNHWAMDWLYDHLFVRPYKALTLWNRGDFVDWFYDALAETVWLVHDFSTTTQTGQLRTYVVVMVAGLILLTAVVLGGATT
jgi:NADH-quinone oxidoreductase subunit L